MPIPHPNYHHATLSAWGFIEKSENYYQRPTDQQHPVLHAIHGRATGLFIWGSGFNLLQADAVSKQALEQVLTRELGVPA
ncbi:hypothetical protein [Hymenobacter fodinae]|uniref:Uncharacterized protein n=1 Tax=Hymenobacter fodinae TaxID=2510796 RepID=A0A4Z0P2D2_9BACT|nr:hypothetical protein [Hymenobacter fodinae]TGE05572.1 hypothetical protein EU556_19930 [Hymenobacter fodinae]